MASPKAPQPPANSCHPSGMKANTPDASEPFGMTPEKSKPLAPGRATHPGKTISSKSQIVLPPSPAPRYDNVTPRRKAAEAMKKTPHDDNSILLFLCAPASLRLCVKQPSQPMLCGDSAAAGRGYSESHLDHGPIGIVTSSGRSGGKRRTDVASGEAQPPRCTTIALHPVPGTRTVRWAVLPSSAT